MVLPTFRRVVIVGRQPRDYRGGCHAFTDHARGPLRAARTAEPRPRRSATRDRLRTAPHVRVHVPRPRRAGDEGVGGDGAGRSDERPRATVRDGRSPGEPGRRRDAVPQRRVLGLATDESISARRGRPRRRRDRRDVAGPRRPAQRHQHRGQAADAHARVRNVAGPSRQPRDRRAQCAVARRDRAHRRASRRCGARRASRPTAASATPPCTRSSKRSGRP